jgi:hypothetical protein
VPDVPKMNATVPPGNDLKPPVDPRLVEALAREYGLAAGDVEVVLREELERLAATARIGTFITVLATSKARVRLQSVTTRH